MGALLGQLAFGSELSPGQQWSSCFSCPFFVGARVSKLHPLLMFNFCVICDCAVGTNWGEWTNQVERSHHALRIRRLCSPPPVKCSEQKGSIKQSTAIYYSSEEDGAFFFLVLSQLGCQKCETTVLLLIVVLKDLWRGSFVPKASLAFSALCLAWRDLVPLSTLESPSWQSWKVLKENLKKKNLEDKTWNGEPV